MDTMQVNIRVFGICQDIIGDKHLSIELDTPVDTNQIMKILKNRYPEMCRLRSISLALNEDYVQENTPVKPNDRIALIPPVAGG